MKKNYIFYLAILICYTSFAQAPDFEWQETYGGTGSEYAYSVKQTPDGGYITAGYTNSTDLEVVGNTGGQAFWVVKTNSLGVLQWQKVLGGTALDRAHAIDITSDGGYIVGGYTFSNNGDVSGNNGGADYWIVKLDSTGDIEWQQTYGGSANEILWDVKQTPDGGYIGLGVAESTDGDISSPKGGQDYWVVKLDSDGALEWEKSYGGLGFDEGQKIALTSDGNYILAGVSNSDDGDITDNKGFSDYWIVKINTTGTIIWQKNFGGSLLDIANDIKETADGGFIIAGYSGSQDGDVVGNTTSSTDYWVVKTDSSGNLEWQKSIAGGDNDLGYGITQTADGGYVVIGDSLSSTGDATEQIGVEDIWVIKLLPNGDIQWQKTLGWLFSDYAYEIQSTSDGGFIVCGSYFHGAGDPKFNQGSNFWMVKYPEESLSTSEFENSNIKIYPNPTTSLLTIDTLHSIDTIQITNMLGQTVLYQNNVLNKTLDVSSLQTGMYFLNLTLNNQQQVIRFVKN